MKLSCFVLGITVIAMTLKRRKIRRVIKLELIYCPGCGAQQLAVVTHRRGHPWPSYVHECTRCGYVIGESEWDPVLTTEEML